MESNRSSTAAAGGFWPEHLEDGVEEVGVEYIPERGDVTPLANQDGHGYTSDHERFRHVANSDYEKGFFETIREHPKVFGWCLYAIFTCLIGSFESVAAGSVLGIPRFRKDFGYPYNGNYVLDARWQAAFYGGPLVSCILGSMGAGSLADVFGRKPIIVLALAISFAAIAMEFVAETNAVFFGGKLMNGVTLGIILSVSLSYFSEITPLRLRGFLTCLSALMLTLGPLMAAIIVNYTGDLDSRWAYRAVFCAQFGLVGFASFIIGFLPESPVWLVGVGKEQKALRSLRRLGYTDIQASNKMDEIQITINKAKRESEGATYLECFYRSNLRRTIISIMPLSIQALCGSYFVSYYTTYYVQLAGFSTQESFKLQVAQHGLSMLGNICSWFLIDKVGRRPLIFWGVFTLTVILMTCAGLGVDGSPGPIKGTVALFLVYNYFYNISLGATGNTLLCEVATSRLRVKTISLGVALQHVLFVLWAFTLPLLFNPDKLNLGAKTAFIFGGISVPCLVYLWFYQVETAGRSYEELDELFMKGISVGKFKGYVTEVQKNAGIARVRK